MHPGDTDRAGADPESEGVSERTDGRSSGADEGEPLPGRTAEEHQVNERTDGGAVDVRDGADRGGRSSDGDRDADTLPYIFARQTVKADREALPVYVRPEIDAAVETLESRLSERFDRDDLMALDVREALLTVGLRNADEVVETLEAWGYGRR